VEALEDRVSRIENVVAFDPDDLAPSPDAAPPPIDNDHVAPGCLPFSAHAENAALRQRIGRLVDEVLDYHHCWMKDNYGYDCKDRGELIRRTYAEADHLQPGDLDIDGEKTP
jgi:hypothetical protein